jgi:hypothetical protein
VDPQRSPEFDPKQPITSAARTVRAVLFSPKAFFLGFSTDGPLGGPTIFVVLLASFAALLSAAVSLLSGLLFGEVDTREVLVTALQVLAFVALSPVAVGVVAGAYLLSVRTFVGKVGTFKELYRITAYAASALALAWVPILGAFALTYALMVIMGIAVRHVYRASFLTAVVVALVGFVPVGTALIALSAAVAGTLFG